MNGVSRAFHVRAAPALLTGVLLMTAATGCFSERLVLQEEGDLRWISVRDEVSAASPPGDCRAWLRRAQRQLGDLLPEPDKPPLLAEDMTTADGQPVDVYEALSEPPGRVHTVFGNLQGMMYSAAASGSEVYIDEPAPLWPGCERVWIPVADGVALSGQLGLARRADAVRNADCVIILPGCLGDTGPLRSRALAQALLAQGVHVLGLEQRGAGVTEMRQPDVPYAFGTFETGDLLAVDEWLKTQPGIRRTGLIGYCWGANQALLAAWEDGRQGDERCVPARLAPLLRPHDGSRHFEAGIIAFAPTLRFEQFVDRCERRWSVWNDAITGRFQNHIERRQRQKGYAVNGKLRELIACELERTPEYYEGIIADGLDYLRLMPYAGHDARDKLEYARVPTLIVHSVDDPMGNAQDIADFTATVENEQVAALLLPGSGHLGFALYARAYFYSLVLNFFDAEHGPAALSIGQRARRIESTGATRHETRGADVARARRD